MKKSNPFTKFLQMLLLVVCIAVFCFSAWQLFQIWKEYQTGNEIYDDLKNQVTVTDSQSDPTDQNDAETQDDSAFYIPEILINMDSLLAINEDAIGWIQIPDTNIDYPVLQGKDNNQYLRTTITGEYNKAGCIFADSRSDQPFEAAATILYGHNLLNGKMFSNLMKYEEKSFWEEHPYVLIQSKNQDKVLVYEIYSCYRTSSNDTTYTFGLETETDSYEDYLNYTRNQALYDTGIIPESTDQIITLSTCTNQEDTERFVVQARLMTE